MNLESRRFSLIYRVKSALRPYKRTTLDFLVFVKSNTRHVVFRFARFFRVFGFFLTNSASNDYTTEFPKRERFNNNLRLGFTKFNFRLYSLFLSQEVSFGIIGANNDAAVTWAAQVSKIFSSKIYWIGNQNDAVKELRIQYLESKNSADLMILDTKEELPTPLQILQLLMARKRLRPELKLAAVHPAYRISGKSDTTFQGFVFNVEKQQWLKNYSEANTFNQNQVPTWSLRPHWHCLLLSSCAVKDFHAAMGGNLSLEEEIESIAQSLWNRNMPILCYPIISVQFVDFDFQPQIAPLNHSWVAQKVNTSKVIFVLPATTLSGGIRVVFEVAEGLSARGIDTEIWSLISPISWEITAVPLKQFNSYLSMIHALQVEDAIKVATWWETADVVFLSSINHGLPVQFVQEFETWFYPDDRSGQAAVVSCYRPEFQYLTTASYQFEELLSIGIQPKLIPVGYDSKTYFQLENVDRQSGVILALGRSFFQKNFKMTARAWNRISHTNLRLWLFGHEPGILTGHNVSYYDRPSNSEVNELLNKAEVFVQTSIHEGFSLPIIEAMAAGCPVITTDSHGNRDFCSDRVNCLVVEQNNDEQLAKLISELLGDPSLRRRLSEEGLATARNYQWSGLLDRYHAYFSAFLKDLK